MKKSLGVSLSGAILPEGCYFQSDCSVYSSRERHTVYFPFESL